MKVSYSIILSLAVLATLFCGCNNEVFIRDYAPSTSEIKLSETDSTFIISFEGTNWEVRSLSIRSKDGFHEMLQGNIYGKDGNLIFENTDLYSKGEELVKMKITHPTLKLTLERTDGKHLRLSQPENMDYETHRLYLSVGNDYNFREINIDIEPSTRYRLDSIAYTLNSYFIQDSMAHKTVVQNFTNLTSDVYTYTLYPYTYFKQEYDFTNENLWYPTLDKEKLKIFGNELPPIPVPTLDKYGNHEMAGATLPLSASTESLDLPDEMLAIQETVQVNPNKRQSCRITCWYQYRGIRFKIYASHPKTGEKRLLEGLLEILIPQSYSLQTEERDMNIQ